MSRSDDTTEDSRHQFGTERRSMIGMLRRLVVGVTSGPFWQGIGVLLIDSASKETLRAENFSGIGFYARPAPGANAEMIVGMLGGAENPAILATRDEATRRKFANIDADETMAYNTKVGVRMSKDSKILACSHGGAPVELAKASELNDLRAFVVAQFSGAGHVHGVAGASTNSTAPVGSPPSSSYPGTDVLKGE